MKKIFLPIILLNMVSCQSDDVADNMAGSVEIADVVLAHFKNDYTDGVSVQVADGNITISSTGLPNHKTPYWGAGNEMYEDFPEGYHANVNTSMSAHNYRMTIATMPAASGNHEETTLGPIGMAVNGVPIYNDREGGNVALDALTITTFDYSGAHPGPGKDYHYHTTGRYTTVDDDHLVGFLRDGFPIYGRRDQDETYPADLDTYGGHFGTTSDFPNGIYHYHASNVNYLNTGYYILKAGAYYGTKGTFTQ
ncbi:MAG: YHYH protein [Imperialibacter sp.]|uniref:YHYH protein n=1 Tax=Imperialibacter sp. TaxID=2038411 RepID=UPI0032EDCC56